MSPGEILNIVPLLCLAVAICLLVLGAVRAAIFGKAFASTTQRSRANWMAFLLLLGAVAYLTGIFQSGIISLIGAVTYFIFPVIFIVFVDKDLGVLREIDFFHRDTYSWSRVRKAAIFAGFAAFAIFFLDAVFLLSEASPPAIAYDLYGLYFVTIVLVLGWASLALVVGSRRTPDLTMRHFAMLLGLGLVIYALARVSWVPISVFFPSFPNAGLPGGFLLAIGAYLWYRSVMSLSPVSRMQLEPEGNPPPAPA